MVPVIAAPVVNNQVKLLERTGRRWFDEQHLRRSPSNPFRVPSHVLPPLVIISATAAQGQIEPCDQRMPDGNISP